MLSADLRTLADAVHGQQGKCACGAWESAVEGHRVLVRRCLPQSESNSQIRRLFSQGAVRINSVKAAMDDVVGLPADLKVGKRRWFRLEQTIGDKILDKKKAIGVESPERRKRS